MLRIFGVLLWIPRRNTSSSFQRAFSKKKKKMECNEMKLFVVQIVSKVSACSSKDSEGDDPSH